MVPALGLTIVHLAAYDFYKESYLQATRPGKGSEGHDADTIEETAQAARQQGPIIRMAMKYALVPHLQRQKAVVSWLNPDAWRLSQVLRSDDQTSELYLYIRVFLMNGIFLVATPVALSHEGSRAWLRRAE